MNKQEFLLKLEKGLSPLTAKEIEERVTFYSEMIDDRIEEGLTECDAVDGIGAVEDIVSQILSDTPITTPVIKKVKKSRRLTTLEIIFLILGSPIWLSLLISALAVIFSLYFVIWSLVVSLWAVEVSVVASSVGGILASLLFLYQGKILSGLALLGVGVLSLGLSIFLFFASKAVTKGIAILTKKTIILIVGKGRDK